MRSATAGHNVAVPEGHTLHRLARDQRELVKSTVSASSPQGRFSYGAAAVDGQVLSSVEAYGKHLHHRYDAEVGVHVHLGMQGKWLRLGLQPPRPQVRLRLATPTVAWDLIAPSTCELLDDVGWKELVSGLGPDPLRDDADPDRAYDRLRVFSGPVGAALLDQSVVAGVGNVLRAEGLFRAGMHPSRAAASLDRAAFDHLWETLVALMRQSVEDGEIARAGRMVYKQERCRRCGAEIEVFPVGGRAAYACSVCQAA